jgi:hypothetical protein
MSITERLEQAAFLDSVMPKVCPRLAAALERTLSELGTRDPDLKYEIATLALLHVAARVIASAKPVNGDAPHDPQADARKMADVLVGLVDSKLGNRRVEPRSDDGL